MPLLVLLLRVALGKETKGLPKLLSLLILLELRELLGLITLLPNTLLKLGLELLLKSLLLL